jgi:hypothetical protein
MKLFLSAKVIEYLKQPCFLNNHTVDPCNMKCIKCGMWGRLVYQFPCPASFKMEITYNHLRPFHMFTYQGKSYMKLAAPEKSFCFDTEQMTVFPAQTNVIPVESAELKHFKLRVERMVTDASIVRKIFSNKDIQRLKDLKPGQTFIDGSNRRFTKLNHDALRVAKGHCSNYFVHDFDPEELVEVVE